MQKLKVARPELNLEAAVNRLDRFDLLILDDLAYVSKDQPETSVLFELISARYEQRSMLITAQSAVRRMEQGLPGPAMPLVHLPRRQSRDERRERSPADRHRTNGHHRTRHQNRRCLSVGI